MMDQAAFDRLRSLEAVKALKEGRIRVGLRCGYCHSESVTEDQLEPWLLECLACGKRTNKQAAKVVRQQAMRSIIQQGVDLPQLTKGK